MHTQPTARCPGAALLEASLVAAQSPPRSRPPQPSPPRGLGAGGTMPHLRPPSAGWSCGSTTRRDRRIYCQPLRGMGRGSDSVSRRWPPRRTADVTGIPSACSYHCADRSGTAPLLCRLLPVLSPLYDPRQAWATTLEHSTAFDRGETTLGSTLGVPPCQTRSTARSTAITTPTTGTTGQGHVSSAVRRFARAMTTPDAMPHSTQ